MNSATIFDSLTLHNKDAHKRVDKDLLDPVTTNRELPSTSCCFETAGGKLAIFKIRLINSHLVCVIR